MNQLPTKLSVEKRKKKAWRRKGRRGERLEGRNQEDVAMTVRRREKVESIEEKR